MSSEDKIIERLKKGDEKALISLMSTYQDFVFSILKAMLYPHEAVEATQDTFIKMYKSAHHFRDRSKFSTWLYSIAYRTGLDYIKKRKPYDELEEGIKISDHDSERSLQQSELRSLIDTKLKELPPEDAALIRMYYLNEYNVKEVAEIMELSVANVKVKLFRIRKTLRATMADLKLTDILQ